MCGIVGRVDWNGIPTESRMLEALATIASRGPDSMQTWRDSHCEFGHLRLAVIDLDARSSQPFHSVCGRYVIVYNGEVYNYQAVKKEIGCEFPWRTESDTEVILAAYLKWGSSCLSKFHGMFAFAIWDCIEKTLFVARDRVGVKPFYFHQADGKFYFSSRPRALFKLIPDLPREYDAQGIRLYLESGYIPAPLTCFKSLRKLEPGCFMIISPMGSHFEHYWTLDGIATDFSLNSKKESELVDELREILGEAVALRMVANVPLGTFLSGGIDSSLIAAIMKEQHSSCVKSFTIGFDDPQFDESQIADVVAKYIKTSHISRKLSSADFLAQMPKFLEEFDEPFFDYSAFPVMAVSQLAREHVTVSLSGDGADEAFGGYHYYKIIKWLALIQKLPASIRKSLAAVVASIPLNRFKLLGRAMQYSSVPSAFAFLRSVIKDFDSILSSDLKRKTYSMAELFEKKAKQFPKNLDPAEVGMRLDLAYTLPDDYLQKVDIGSMAFSLEAREPYLDHTILEWAAKLPVFWKLKGNNGKFLLRKLAFQYVPADILDRPKMGFGVPMASWLRNDLKSWGEDLLQEDSAMKSFGLNPSEIRKLWDSHQSGTREAHSCLWSVLVLLQFNRKILNENRD